MKLLIFFGLTIEYHHDTLFRKFIYDFSLYKIYICKYDVYGSV